MLNLVKSDELFKLLFWFDFLLQIEMLLVIQVDVIVIDGFCISQVNELVIDISCVCGGIEIVNGEFQVYKLVVDSDMGNFIVQGCYILVKDYDIDVMVMVVLLVLCGCIVVIVGLVVRGDLLYMEVVVVGCVLKLLYVMLVFDGCIDLIWNVSVCSDELDLVLLLLVLVSLVIVLLLLDFIVVGKGGNVNLCGRVKQGDQELELVLLVVLLQDQVLKVLLLLLKGFGGEVCLEGIVDFSQ